jgi:hypothetical protein
MREPGVREPADQPVGQRKLPASTAEIAQTVDAATLRAVARNVHRGAWWRRVRRQGLTGAPGVAEALGILAVLSCLAVGGAVSFSRSPGLFRGGDIRVDAVDRSRDSTNPESPSGMENSAMQAMKLSAALVGVALSGSGALAQGAVEWKVSEGGMGIGTNALQSRRHGRMQGFDVRILAAIWQRSVPPRRIPFCTQQSATGRFGSVEGNLRERVSQVVAGLGSRGSLGSLPIGRQASPIMPTCLIPTIQVTKTA